MHVRIKDFKIKKKKKESDSHSVVSDSLQSHGLTVAHQVPLSMRFSRQEYWSGLQFPPPKDLSDPGLEPASPVSPVCRQILYQLSHMFRAHRQMAI